MFLDRFRFERVANELSKVAYVMILTILIKQRRKHPSNVGKFDIFHHDEEYGSSRRHEWKVQKEGTWRKSSTRRGLRLCYRSRSSNGGMVRERAREVRLGGTQRALHLCRHTQWKHGVESVDRSWRIARHVAQTHT